MKYWLLGLLLATFFYTEKAHSTDGAQLLEMCVLAEEMSKDSAKPMVDDAFDTGVCMGIMESSINALQLLDEHGAVKYSCVPYEDINLGQVRSITIKFLEDNPKYHHMPATYLTITAVQFAFPCVREP